MGENGSCLESQDQHAPAEKLSAARWGVFFTWVGIGFLTGIGWGLGLVGVDAGGAYFANPPRHSEPELRVRNLLVPRLPLHFFILHTSSFCF